MAQVATDGAASTPNTTLTDNSVASDPPSTKHPPTPLRPMDRDPSAKPAANPSHLQHLDNPAHSHPSHNQPQPTHPHPNGSSQVSATHDSLHSAQSHPPDTPVEHIPPSLHSNRVAPQLQPNPHPSVHSHSPQTQPDHKPHSPDVANASRQLPQTPQLVMESAPLETSRASHQHQPFNMVSSFSDLSLNAPMEYASTLQIMPMQPQPIIPISPQHAGQVAQQNRRHHHHHQHPIVHNHNHQHTFQMWVPQERVGAVIGGHGAVIRSLQEKSGAAIQVHNDTVRNDRKLFTIFGTRAQYETAAQLVNEIVERPRPSSHYPSHHNSSLDTRSHYSSLVHSTSNHMSTKVTTSDMCKTVYVPTSCVGLVIGRNGETIKSLQDRSGAEIKVTPDRKATPGSDDRSILISGTEEAIATAHQLVSEIVNDARSRRPSPHGGLSGSTYKGHSVFMETLAVPNEKVGLIIGKKGITIRELQMKSGAGIQVAKDDSSIRSDGSRPITITGSRIQVEDAKAMIASKINVNMLTTIHPPTTFQSSLVGTHGIPLAPGQPPGLQYVMPNVYEAEYSNGQMHTFPQVVDLADPNNSHTRHPMAFMPYFAYNNVAPVPQHRQFAQQAAQIPFNPALHQHQQPPSSQQQALRDQTSPGQPHSEQESQLASSMLAQPQQQLDGITPPPPVNMVGGEANPGFVMFPSHPFHPMASQMQPQHIYQGLANTRVFPREAQAQAHAQAQMFAHAQAQAQAQAQMQSQPFSQVQPLASVPSNENAESSPLDQQSNEAVQNSAPIPSEIEQPDR
ncbi:unnamed protein product [Agarophyton chilense]|eukprot:gb/GEZJ01000437.1/.p1 GENE.gb/GEZJ01000437.1/~~gb/GEZJ01000437.1/.p1  ORF type:complete len:791 (+),score=92.49 gb/GEZJ01000437.1/:402-2774(+)